MANERSQSYEQQRETQSLERRDEGKSSYKPVPFGLWGGDLFSMSPFALFRAMSEQMDRAFSGMGMTGQTGGRAMQNWMPAMEVREKDGKLVISADLPGIDKKDVKVEVTNDTLVIEGERKQEHEEARGEWHRSERSYGHFYRAIPLPEGAKSDQVRAEFQNGVLNITIPVEPSKTSRRQIEIR